MYTSCDLRDLPYRVQLYWKSFNEDPKAGISEGALRMDFLKQRVGTIDALGRIKRVLRQWEQADVPWWKLRDPTSIRRVIKPLTSSLDE